MQSHDVLMLLSLAAAGCGLPCRDLGKDTGAGPQGFFATNQPAQVVLQQHCARGRSLDRVVTGVLDPLNQRVASTQSALVSSESGYSTTVSFTPTRVGNHHVTARFDPSLGDEAIDVEVALHRTEPSRVLALGTQCVALEELPSGLVLCLPWRRSSPSA